MTTHVDTERFKRERDFHDNWASSAADSEIDPVKVNTALTSPELRQIHKALEPIQGKKLMDLGCGLGEASAYFALSGADVTSVDLSPEMLNVTKKLANQLGTDVKTHLAEAETLGFQPEDRFDIIYVGNLFHHVDIPATLDQLMPHLKEDGVLVSWDPLDYNPVINVYRAIATEVRTEDEHPLKRRDVKEITGRFEESNVQFYWLTTLIIFILMAFVERKNPNKVRFWKAVVDDADKWAWLYKPLAKVDRFLLKCFPFLGWLCWNVVIVAKKPKA